MAKDRHRQFEIYPTRDEAAWELMPKGNKAKDGGVPPEKWNFKQLNVASLAGIVHVQFKESALASPEIAAEIDEDLGGLADQLSGNSRVLLDFTGVESFSPVGITALNLFNRKLHIRGSRMVLCCLGATVRPTFFPET